MSREYIDTLEHEICGTVDYYNNKINNVDVYTIGCDLSQWDGEHIVELIGNTNEKTLVLNTCAVTENTHITSQKIAERLKLIYPDRKLYITGCSVNYDAVPYKDYENVYTNEEKFNEVYYNNKDGLNKKFRHGAYSESCIIKIQDGCTNRCAYCAIPFLKGKPYSVPYEEIKKQIKNAIETGKTILDIMGTEICSYNSDGMKIHDLCKRILDDFPEVRNISLGALDPASPYVDKLIDLIKDNDRMYKVMFLSTQSCSNTILKLMNRRHTYERMAEIASKGDGKVFFSWHVIVGFPGETEEYFQETLNAMKKLKPIAVDALPFSRRKGTKAYDMEQTTSDEEIRERMARVYKVLQETTNCNHLETIENSYVFMKQDVYKARMEYFPYDAYKNDDTKFVDLYNLDEFVNLWKGLEDKSLQLKYDTIITNYCKDKDFRDYELNVKMLVFNFGIKIISNMLLTNNLINDVLNDMFDIKKFVLYKDSYIRFLPSDDEIDRKLFSKFILKIKHDKSYPLDILQKDFKNNSHLYNLIREINEIDN